MSSSLEQILEEMIENRRMLRFSEQTIRGDKSLTRKFIRFLKDKHSITDIDQLRGMHLQSYQKYLMTLKGKYGMPMRPNSMNSLITAVHVFIDFMVERGYASHKLKKDLQKVREDKLLPTSVLTHDQAKQLIASIDTNSAEGVRNRCIVELMYSAGIRGGELVGLTLDDLNLEKGIIKVFGKGSKERMVPIGQTAIKYLTNYISAIRPYQRNADQFREVFMTYRGTALKLRSLQTVISNISKAANLGVNVTPHTLRRSCATELIRGDANMYHVKEILGHESIETLKHYTKLTIVDLKQTHSTCHPRDKWK